MHRQFINSRLSCSISFFATNTSQFFILLAIFFLLIFSEQSAPHFPVSTQIIFSLWPLSAHWFACCSCNRWDSKKLLIVPIKSNISISPFPMFHLHVCLSFEKLLSQFFLLERPVQLSNQGLCGDFPCLLTIAQRFDLNPPSPFDSDQADFSVWPLSAHRLAWCSWNRWDSNSWLISWKAMSKFLVSQFLASTSASAWYNFCWAILSPRTADSTFRSKTLWRFSLSLNSQRKHNVLISISFPLWLRTENRWNNRFSVQTRTSFLDAITTVNQLRPLSPEARTWRS